MMSKEYHAAKATPDDRLKPVSKSTLWAFDKSPYKWANGGEKAPTSAMQLGSCVHLIALEPEKLCEEFAVSPYDSFRSKEAREWKEGMLADGKIVLTEKEYAEAIRIAESAQGCISRALQGSAYAVEQEVHGEFNEVQLCGLIDIVPESGDCLWDLKTCSSIGDERALSRTIFDNGYHVQAALYADLWAFKEKRGMEPPGFGFVFVETSFPYESTFVELSANALAAGRARYIQLIDRWKDLREVPIAELPGAVRQGLVIEPPEWLMPA